MRKLILHGDPGVRKDGIIEYEGEELVVFAVSRNGEWHGPEDPQLWCTVGHEDERGAFERRDFVPHFLETMAVDAGDIEVLQRKGTPGA
jgi:hypothetical protein